MPKGILIADDNLAIRKLVRFYFEDRTEFKICGEAADGQDAVDKAKLLKPDLVILDFAMPGMDGLKAARILRYTMPNVPIILFTIDAKAMVFDDVYAAGVDAVVLKTGDLENLSNQVRSLLNGPRDPAAHCS